VSRDVNASLDHLPFPQKDDIGFARNRIACLPSKHRVFQRLMQQHARVVGVLVDPPARLQNLV